MTSLQSQYLLCPPLACSTAQTRLDIDPINRQIRSCKILAHSCSRACYSYCRVSGAGWQLRTRRSISSHKWSIEFKYGDLDGQGSTVTFWLARKSTVARTVCGRALSCWKTFIRRFIAGSMCQNLISVSRGVTVAGDVHQLSFSGAWYGNTHHHTSSAEIVDLKDAVPCEPLIPASVDTCFLQHESWFVAEPDLPPVLQVPAPYFVAPSDSCKSMPTSQYCAKVRTSGA
jgi:hypothetical protein